MLVNHAWDATARIAIKAAEKSGVNITTPKIDERVDYDHISDFNQHWWEDVE